MLIKTHIYFSNKRKFLLSSPTAICSNCWKRHAQLVQSKAHLDIDSLECEKEPIAR